MSRYRPFSSDRRALVKGLGATAVTGPAFLFGRPARAEGGSLFTLGVASGDPAARSVVLWTRLAPDPLNGGGLRRPVVPVRWKVATDPGMRHVVRRGVAAARADRGHAVTVVARGLPSNSWLYYQFSALGQTSRIGRTRTFPGRFDRADRMRFGVANCQNYVQGAYPAYRDMLDQELDFVVHLGDYMYEGAAVSAPLIPGRNHNGGESVTVEDYRNRYALYRLDPDLQDAHAQFPFLVTWDDHEVDNNYAGLVPEDGQTDFARRRRDAYRVYAETMPLRPRTRRGNRSGSLRLFRKLSFGNLADIHMLDTRQFRTDQPADDGFGSRDILDPAVEGLLEATFGETLFDPDGIEDPGATMLGAGQEMWLARNLRRSRARWNVLAQQVMQTEWNLRATGRLSVEAQLAAFPPDPASQAQAQAIRQALGQVGEILNVDAWDGYQAARARLFGVLDALRPNNPIVLTGDIHSAWAANLRKDFANPASDVLAAEFVATSISSTFLAPDPRPTDFIVRASLPDNPHIDFFNALFRGYIVCDVDHRRWQSTYRAVGDIAQVGNTADPLALLPRAGSPVATDAVFEVDAGFNAPGNAQALRTVFRRI